MKLAKVVELTYWPPGKPEGVIVPGEDVAFAGADPQTGAPFFALIVREKDGAAVPGVFRKFIGIPFAHTEDQSGAVEVPERGGIIRPT